MKNWIGKNTQRNRRFIDQNLQHIINPPRDFLTKIETNFENLVRLTPPLHFTREHYHWELFFKQPIFPQRLRRNSSVLPPARTPTQQVFTTRNSHYKHNFLVKEEDVDFAFLSHHKRSTLSPAKALARARIVKEQYLSDLHLFGRESLLKKHKEKKRIANASAWAKTKANKKTKSPTPQDWDPDA